MMADPTISVVGFDEYFVHRIAADDVSKGKPDPEIFLKAAAKI